MSLFAPGTDEPNLPRVVILMSAPGAKADISQVV